ncbi:MAG: type II toxin-antitoxin system PemK/MazF family toxin [Thermodesulfovibrionales bacterium]|nr:type II toxin-antitoxin system PemK/MazF family toxin [Thermodesulfovibrionales bacterium]MDP3111568.1 type II toxin-antitoxin system PemK/MazF family toxin [Thermodesulfovibrionales bacterium]
MTAYNFGDVVLVGFPHSDLHGVSKRPALVLYDSGDQDVLVARITTQEYTTDADYKIIDWRRSGLLAESFVRFGKQATIEKKFVVKKLGALAEPEPQTIKAILRGIYNL